MKYGAGQLNGVIVSDTVCLNDSPDFCAVEFPFFLVTSAEDGVLNQPTNIDGILGMSPYHPIKNPKPYIQMLFDQG